MRESSEVLEASKEQDRGTIVLDRSDFTSIDESAWAALQEAAAEPRSPFRHLVLCSVGRGHTPRARTLVLRSARRTRRELELHTDTRSPKWQELGANPKVTILGYDPQLGSSFVSKARSSYIPPVLRGTPEPGASSPAGRELLIEGADLERLSSCRQMRPKMPHSTRPSRATTVVDISVS